MLNRGTSIEIPYMYGISMGTRVEMARLALNSGKKGDCLVVPAGGVRAQQSRWAGGGACCCCVNGSIVRKTVVVRERRVHLFELVCPCARWVRGEETRRDTDGRQQRPLG